MSLRSNGSYIGQRPTGPVGAYNGAASGIWDLRTAQRQQAAGTWPIAEFTPDVLTGLQLWLDASDASTLYDATSGGALASADGVVRRWEDKSGNNRHAASSSGPTRKVAQQNGLGTLLFNGSSTFLSSTNEISTGNARTVFSVVKSSDTVGNDFFQIGLIQSASSRLFSLRQSYNAPNSGISSDMVANNINVPNEQLTINQFHVSCWRQTSSTRAVRYWHDGTEKTVTGTHDSFSANAGYLVGKGNTGSDTGFWNGHVCEIIIYNSALSDTDREAVENYLLAKWAIT